MSIRMKRRTPVNCCLGLVALVTGACQGPPALDNPQSGGGTTTDDRTSKAFGRPAPNLSESGLAQHLAGDIAFEAKFVTPPAAVNGGLGPRFNNNACVKCHLGDGRGPALLGDPTFGDSLLVRLSLPNGKTDAHGGPAPLDPLGTQLQTKAVAGIAPEASVTLSWSETPGAYGDGTPYLLRRPLLRIALPNGEELPSTIPLSLRIPPPVFGLGLLEAVPEETLRALADPSDLDRDGISGRVNEVWDVQRSATVIGRFGWKANQPSLRQQAAAAYFNDMGVTTELFPEADGSVELPRTTLDDVTFYAQSLAVPIRGDLSSPEVRRGMLLFQRVRCGACHVSELSTGDEGNPATTNQMIHPFTDLLLHDMGEGLADNRPDFLASGREWRTAPLWGIGISETVLPGASYLHDGRARTLDEAILWHGGEGEGAKEAFRTMSATDRAALSAFLRSL